MLPGIKVNAQSGSCNPALGPCPEGTLPAESATIALDNPLGTDDPRVLIGQIIRVLLGVVGSLALVFFIYGGLTWMTSAGSANRVESGKNTLIWATLGLVVIFTSYTVLTFILTNIPKS